MTLDFDLPILDKTKDERLLRAIEEQRRAYNLTWDAYCAYLEIPKKTIFRWKNSKKRKIGKVYLRCLDYYIDELGERLKKFQKEGTLETRNNKLSK
jgi:hypothetical protein